MGIKTPNVIPPEEITRQISIAENIKKHFTKPHFAMVITLGCQQNENDSERLWGYLDKMGYEKTDKTEEADIIIYNTCAVRENAELKVFGNLGALVHQKRKKSSLIIGVCGCMMQQEKASSHIKSKFKHVDLIFGTHTLYKFPEILNNVLEKNARCIDISCEDGRISEQIPVKRNSSIVCNVSIMYGCNNFCSYCIVPYVRGRERSRRKEDIIAEINSLIKNGCKEIMLLGQNVNSYMDANGTDFPALLTEICTIDGLERIRFMTSHPKDISDRLIDVMARNSKICRQLHLPVQSGSSRILSLMNRKYTAEKYLETIKKVKEKIPGIALSSDIIVGFPGETEEDFANTMALVKEVEYDLLYTFIYSKRGGTPAATMEDNTKDEDKHKRFDSLKLLQDEISLKKNKVLEGTEQYVLIEGKSKSNDSRLTGRTDGGKLVHLNGSEDNIGKIVKVLINKASTWYLEGEII